MELGVGDGRRATRMIEIARRMSPGAEVSYIGMDLFEARSATDGPGLSLKAAHQLLRASGAQVRLVPGNPADSLIRSANAAGQVDVLIVPGELDSPSFSRMWLFVPRMLHKGSIVFVERTLPDGEKSLSIKQRAEIEQQAAAGSRRKAA